MQHNYSNIPFYVNLNLEHSSYNELFILCMQYTIKSMQCSIDISHEVICTLFESSEFTDYVIKYLIYLSKELKQELDEKCIDVNQNIYLNNPLKKEYCGHINRCHVNGYIEYCNVHKYTHHESSLDHDFLYKTHNDAVNEYNIEVKYELYKETFMKLMKAIMKYVNNKVKLEYTKKVLKMNRTILMWLKNNPISFKLRNLTDENDAVLYIKNEQLNSFNTVL